MIHEELPYSSATTGGRDLAVDVSVVGPLHFNEHSGKPMDALEKGVSAKNTKYLTAFETVGINFIPFICGSMGGFAKDAETLIKKIAYPAALHSGQESKTAPHYLRMLLNFKIQQGNAISLVRRSTCAYPTI